MKSNDSVHGQFSSKLAFVLATMGAAIGLGNIWRFPYITGENGGGAFVLVYLCCILLIGLPLMIAEVMLGRRGKQSSTHSMANLAREAGVTEYWKYVGALGIIAGYFIVTYYCVIAGQVLKYVFIAGSGGFVGASPDEVGNMFDSLVASPGELMLLSGIFIGMIAYSLSHKLEHGLERVMNFMMPLMIFIMLFMVAYAMTTGSFVRGVTFLFAPDFSKINGDTILIALGQAFFSLGIAMGILLTFGAYLPKGMSIMQTTSIVAFADTFIAVLAGVAIFPIVFAYGLEPNQGPSLIFKTLPLAFGAMPLGTWIGALFFLMLFFAAFSSAAALVEPAIAWLQDKSGMKRSKAAYIICSSQWFVGLGSVFSYNVWESHTIFGMTVMGFIDYVTANYMLPVGGLLLAIFAAWIIKRDVAKEELGVEDKFIFKAWYFCIRFICPVAILIIFVKSL